MDVKRLVEYALMLDIGAVYRSLGYLPELFETKEEDQLELLRKKTHCYLCLPRPDAADRGQIHRPLAAAAQR
jgi:hypothetical protein